MPVTDTITTFYSFTARTQIKSADMNNNFSVFRGHLIAVDGSLTSLAVTNSYDLGSSTRYWRAGYITQVNCSTISATTIVGTSINATTIIGTSINATTIVGTTITATSLVATTATVSSVLDMTGGQIKFPATAAPSSDANTLDDYQEEDWTPRIDGSSSTGTASASIAVGKCVKVGKRVFLDFYVNWSGGTGTGNLRIANLPYASANVTNYRASGSIGYLDSVALTAANTPMAVLGANVTYIDLYQMPSGGGTVAAVPYDAAGLLMCSIAYNIS